MIVKARKGEDLARISTHGTLYKTSVPLGRKNLRIKGLPPWKNQLPTSLQTPENGTELGILFQPAATLILILLPRIYFYGTVNLMNLASIFLSIGKSITAAAFLLVYALPVLAGDILEFRLAKSLPTNGWTKVEFSGKSLWLHPRAEDLTSAHVASAEFQWSRPMSPERIAQLKKVMPEIYLTPSDTHRQPQIVIKFTEQGKDLFAKVTGDNYNHRLAILYEGSVLTAPVIRDKVTGGVVVIGGNGSFTEVKAKELIEKLNNQKSNKAIASDE